MRKRMGESKGEYRSIQVDGWVDGRAVGDCVGGWETGGLHRNGD